MTSAFDAKAATWDDDPAKRERAARVAVAIRRSVPLDRATRLLEYGAGTGLLGTELRDHVGELTLADASAGMREVIRQKVDAGVLAGARVWDLDLTTDRVPTDRFDVIVTMLTLHHILDLDPVLTAFRELLDDQGRLVVVDLVAEDGSFHGPGFEGHDGFGRDDLTARLAAVGLTVGSFEHCTEITKGDVVYPVFLTVAVRDS